MAFSLNQTTVLSAFRSGNLLSAVNSMISPGYGIYYAFGQRVGDKPFTPASFIAVEVTREASITTAPIEKGGYTSYNKVQRPGEVHVTFSFEGWTGFSGSVSNLTNLTLTSRSDVLEALDKMVSSAEIYDIETPDTTYTSYDLIKYDFRIRQDNGVTLLIVTAVFHAVQDIAEVKMSSNVANKSNTTKNETAKGPSKNTEQSTGSTKYATLSDVKKALIIKSNGKTVDVKPMVHNMTGTGRRIENGIIYNVPVFHLQRGNSAVIMNPVVGDIGLIAICDRDISSIRATKAPALPGSKRTHNYSDAIYLGGVLNAEPQQYVEFVDNQINIVSPNKINVVAPTTEMTSSNSITMNSPSIILNGAVIQGGGGNGGNATFGSTVTAKGEITGNGIKLSSHVHGGVESGGSKTNSPE